MGPPSLPTGDPLARCLVPVKVGLEDRLGIGQRHFVGLALREVGTAEIAVEKPHASLCGEGTSIGAARDFDRLLRQRLRRVKVVI